MPHAIADGKKTTPFSIPGPLLQRVSSERAGIGAAVDEPVLPGDVARLLAAQPRTGGAELVPGAEAAGGDGRHALGAHLLDPDLPRLRPLLQGRAPPAVVPRPPHPVLDGYL